MRYKTRPAVLAATVAALLTALMARPATAQTLYGLSNGNLIRFEANAPGAVTTIGALTEDIVNIDFRPADGRLYGYAARLGVDDDAVYAIDTTTAALSLIRTTTPATNTALLGIDFDPDNDRLRVASDLGENLRMDITGPGGATTVDGDFSYIAGDRFAGRFPLLIDIAYTPSNALTPSVLYGIDYLRDTLVRFDSPVAGTLITVGNLGVNTDRFTGFDITTGTSGPVAYASLGPSFNPADPSGLYTVSLTTGAATRLGTIGAPGVYSIAVAPSLVSAAPEPGALLLLAALLPFALRFRRRRSGNIVI